VRSPQPNRFVPKQLLSGFPTGKFITIFLCDDYLSKCPGEQEKALSQPQFSSIAGFELIFYVV
jgi:hypothetical protein